MRGLNMSVSTAATRETLSVENASAIQMQKGKIGFGEPTVSVRGTKQAQ